MTVVGIARKSSCPNHQPALVHHRKAGLDAKFVGLPGLTLADALDFRCMRGVELALVFRLLGSNSLGSFQNRYQSIQAEGQFRLCLRQFTTDFSQQDAQNGALTVDDFLHPPKLLGVGIAAGTTPQFLAFLDKGLLEFDADVLGSLHHLVPGNFE